MPIILADLGITCALGSDKNSVLDTLLNRDFATSQTTLTARDNILVTGERLQVGQVNLTLPSLDSFAPVHRTRNNQLAYHAFLQIKAAFKQLSQDVPAHRIAVVLGTSTSGIQEGEQAVAHIQQSQHWPQTFSYSMQEMSAPADFIAAASGATGPVYSVSTACTSSAKALVSAKLLLEQNIADVVIAGGVDTLSNLPCNGFNALESTSADICQPFAAERDGINLGEAAALFVLHRNNTGIALLGAGESSDAYHISSPDPTGDGAYRAMSQALSRSGLTSTDIDYLNLHGTATPKNDEMEALAVNRLFGARLPCSSTKHLTGHTLGAAGAIEAGLCWLILSQYNSAGKAPANAMRSITDPDLAPIGLWQGDTLTKRQYCMSNSFAFGGNNVSLVLGDVRE